MVSPAPFPTHRLYLIRHGQAQGWPRSLTPHGKTQARKTARWLAQENQGAKGEALLLLTSPARRTQQTSAYISKTLGCGLQEAPLLAINADPLLTFTYLQGIDVANLVAVSHQPLLWALLEAMLLPPFSFAEASVCCINRLTTSQNAAPTWQIEKTFIP